MLLLLDRLKADTAEHHARVERGLDLTRADLTQADWVETLKRFYGFVAPWESAIRAHAGVYPAERHKAAFLERDLAHFGVAAADLPLCPNVPSTDTVARALGSAYVLEGSTLGGRFVADRVTGHLGLHDGGGYSYFVCYGPRTGAMWNAFRQTITRVGTALDPDVIVAAARDTFDRIHDWFRAAPAADGDTKQGVAECR